MSWREVRLPLSSVRLPACALEINVNFILYAHLYFDVPFLPLAAPGSLRLEFYGRVQRTTGGPDLVAGVCVSIGLADNERCLDLLDGNAPSPTPSGSEGFKGVSIAGGRLRFEHFIFQVGFRKPPSLPSWESFLEVAFGMRICPEVECKEGPSSPGLFLQGSIRGELSVTGFSAGGGLRQIGT